MTEKQSGKNLKIIRTDGGDEFTSREFENFYLDQGIVHEIIAPYTPQHNGVVERRNMIVMNMVRDVHFEEISSWTDLLRIIEQKKTIHLIPTPDEHDVPDEVESAPRQTVTNATTTRPTRIRQPPKRLNEYELFPDDAITEEGDLIHLSLMGETKPITFQ
ncbi:PREDICTED: uncharacterized protein LOC109359651 [Lupinus angustifolius]|uniref:uncharacterized protein LOC109359651 n=1 Tax=Lupinus angustifolius TaxID=3871 RepID=UPI00092EED0C|nr:PREDICTED: uncharacterized protein LOC109359651 [Lupinus angustifolius]